MNAHMKLQEMLSEDILKTSGKLVPIHVTGEEVKLFNIMQGGTKIDNETGLREYSLLSEILKVPEIRNIFIATIDVLKSGEPIPEDLEVIMQTPVKGEHDELEPIPSDHDPYVQKMAHAGGRDHYIVMMPEDVVMFFDFLQGNSKHDPSLGLQKFFNFGNVLKSVVRVGATALGAVVGGPVGAGLGNMLGRVATGQKFGSDLLGAGLKNGLYAWGASGLMGAGGLGLGAMGTSGAGGLAGLQSGLGLGAGGGLTQFASKLGMLGAAPAAAPLASTVAPGLATTTATTAPAAAGTGLLGSLTANAPMGLLGAGMLMQGMGARSNEKEARRRQQKEEEMYEHERKRQERMNEDRREHRRKREEELNAEGPSIRMDPFGSTSRYYKKGGFVTGVHIKGKGTGQSDEIPKTSKEKSWIWDATTTAHIGDGSSIAGQKRIEEFEKRLKKSLFEKHKPEIVMAIKEKPLRNVPCLLSNDERETNPVIVAAAGKGDFDKGAKVLRIMTKEIRRHKMKNGLELPPPAQDLMTVYKKAVRKV